MELLLFIAGLFIIAVGGAGSILSYVVEVGKGEPKYIALMKIFSLMIAIGGFICGMSAFV